MVCGFQFALGKVMKSRRIRFWIFGNSLHVLKLDNLHEVSSFEAYSVTFRLLRSIHTQSCNNIMSELYIILLTLVLNNGFIFQEVDHSGEVTLKRYGILIKF